VCAQKRHAWVFAMLEANPEGGVEFEASEALPDASPDAQKRAIADVKAWLQGLPLARRPLCKVRGTSVVAAARRG
jgi:hypothetical protein